MAWSLSRRDLTRAAIPVSARHLQFRDCDWVRRDKLSLNLSWLHDPAATIPDTLLSYAVIAVERVGSSETVLENFRLVAAKLGWSLR